MTKIKAEVGMVTWPDSEEPHEEENLLMWTKP